MSESRRPRCAASLLFLALLSTAPASAQAIDADEPVSNTVRMDDPNAQERINREIWESVKKTPYSDALQHVTSVRALSANAVATVTLPTGWKIGPAGVQINVGHLPFDALPFNGSVVVMNTGYYNTPQNFMAIDPSTGVTKATINVQNLYPGAAAGPDGKLYVSGGKSNIVYWYDQNFKAGGSYSLPGYGRGLASYDATHLIASYTAAPQSGGLTRPGHVEMIDTTTGATVRDMQIADQEPYAVAVVSGKIYATIPALNQVVALDQNLNTLSTVNVGLNPLATCQDASNLYVVNMNSDSVSVINSQTDLVSNTFSTQFLGINWGAGPSSCAVDDVYLYVTLTQVNAVAVLQKTSGALQGYMPTGWYPSKVVSLQDRLAIISAKGIQPLRPNSDGTYVLNLLQGTLGLVNKSDILGSLAAWTRQVQTSAPYLSMSTSPAPNIDHVFYIVKENRTYDQVLGDLGKGNGDPYLTTFGVDVTPIQHYLAGSFPTLDNTYVDGEVSTTGHGFTASGFANPYFQMLTSLDYSGRLDSSSDLYPAGFSKSYIWDVLSSQNIDYRIYGEAEYFKSLYEILTQDTSANSPLAAKMLYLANPDQKLSAAMSQLAKLFSGHMQDVQTASGLRTLLANPQFGKPFSQILAGDDSLYTAMTSNSQLFSDLVKYFAHWQFNYATFNLNISDLTRMEAWLQDFQTRDAAGLVPPFNYLILPNDHTAGDNPNWTPVEYVAQNDAAFDIFMRTLSQSRLWNRSIVFAIEDDAQDGADHVDATRTTAYVASPWVKRGVVLSDRWDQLSMVRTIGLLLGAHPVSMNDAVATPMFNLFSTTASPDYMPPSVSSQLAADDLALYQQLLGMINPK